MATTSLPAEPTSAQARLTIQEAFRRLKQSVTPDDARRFQDTTLRDVQDAAVVVEDKLAASKSLRNLRRIEPFLTSLGHYAKVIEVLCNGTDYLPWIWAPIKLLLHLSLSHISSLEKLIDAYAQICDTFPRFERLRTAFQHDVDFQKVLAMFYADILEFHRRAYKFFTQRSWKRFFDTSWSGFRTRFKGILESLAKNAELVEKEATAADIVEAKMLRERQQEIIDRAEKDKLTSQMTSVLSWLDLGGCLSQDDELDRLLGHYSPGSCNWIFSHAALKRWREDSNQEALLWIHGKPGAGKSVICSYLIQELQQQHEVLYFFCSYRSSSSCANVFRSLTAQILNINPDLALYIYDQINRNALTSSVRSLKRLVPDLLSSLKSPRIVLDGIDESPPDEQKTILKEIKSLVKECSVNPCCKALFCSQDVPNISRSLPQKSTISLTHESRSVNSAIEAFVDNEFKAIKDKFDEFHLGQGFASSMKQKIVERANGMFLWVYLVINSLKDIYNFQHLQQAVGMLPNGLGEIYARILRGMRQRLELRDFERAVRILEWVIFSRRPLKKAEILDGIALHRGNTELDSSTKLLEQVLDTCKPLIEQDSNDMVVLVHFSLKEYLQTPGNLIPICKKVAHFDLALACVVIMEMALDLLDQSIPEDYSIINTGNGLLNLLPYAHKFWADHLLCFAELSGRLSCNETSTSQLLGVLSSLSARHERLLGVFHDRGSNSTNFHTLVQETHLVSIDPDAEFYSLVYQTVSFRDSLKLKKSLSGPELHEFELNNDPTLMSYLIHKYARIVQILLSADEVPGLSNASLSAFKKVHGSTAFKCRFGICCNSSQGFPTADDRVQHEKTAHVDRFFCSDADCAFRTLGYASSSALTQHQKEYHDTTLEHRSIPGSIRRKNPRGKVQSPQEERRPSRTTSLAPPIQAVPLSVLDTPLAPGDPRAPPEPISQHQKQDQQTHHQYLPDIQTPREGSTYASFESLECAVDSWVQRELSMARLSLKNQTSIIYQCHYFGQECSWELHATINKNTGVLTVLTVVPNHTCISRVFEDDDGIPGLSKYGVRNTQRWVEDAIQRADFNVTVHTEPLAIVALIRDYYKEAITEHLAAKSKQRLLEARASQIPADVPMPLRQKMMELPENHFHQVLERWLSNPARKQWFTNGNASQPGQQMTPQALQCGQPEAPMGTGQNSLQQNQQRGVMNPAQMQRIQQELLRRQQQQGGPALNPQILQRMDQIPVLPAVIQDIKNRDFFIPDNIRLWGQLKEWASRNPNVVSMDKLDDLQKAHYDQMMQYSPDSKESLRH